MEDLSEGGDAGAKLEGSEDVSYVDIWGPRQKKQQEVMLLRLSKQHPREPGLEQRAQGEGRMPQRSGACNDFGFHSGVDATRTFGAACSDFHVERLTECWPVDSGEGKLAGCWGTTAQVRQGNGLDCADTGGGERNGGIAGEFLKFKLVS